MGAWPQNGARGVCGHVQAPPPPVACACACPGAHFMLPAGTAGLLQTQQKTVWEQPGAVRSQTRFERRQVCSSTARTTTAWPLHQHASPRNGRTHTLHDAACFTQVSHQRVRMHPCNAMQYYGHMAGPHSPTAAVLGHSPRVRPLAMAACRSVSAAACAAA